MKMPEVKKVEAQGRQDYFSKLSTAEKIAHLDTRLGKGKGAAKERAKLAKQLEKEAAEKAAEAAKANKKGKK